MAKSPPWGKALDIIVGLKFSSVFGSQSIVRLLVLSCTFIIIVAGAAVVTPFSYIQSALAQQASFDNPITLDNRLGDQVHPHVAASVGNNVYVAYTSEISGQSSILFTRSTDRGTSFSTPISVSNDISGSSFSFLNAIAANGDNVYVVWTRVTDVSSIYLAKSSNGGVTFSSPVQVESGGNARAPAIAVSGVNVFVAWQDFSSSESGLDAETFVAVSTDGGTTFRNPVDISNSDGTLSRNPSVASSGNNVYVVWADCDTTGLNCKILYVESNDNGVTFNNPIVLGEPESSLPDISVQGNTVYVVYGHLFTDAQNVRVRDVFLVKGTDTPNGNTEFSDSFNISNDPELASQNPRIDTSGTNVAIQWEQRDPSHANPHWEVVFVGSNDGGITFGSQTSVTENNFPTLNANLNDIAISGSNLYSIFMILIDDFDVYFAKGTLTPIDVTPPEAIENLINTIDGMNLDKGTQTSLNGPLHNTIRFLEDNNPSNDAAVCDKLSSFLKQVDAKEANGKLTAQQAEELRRQATLIHNSLGCPPTTLLLLPLPH